MSYQFDPPIMILMYGLPGAGKSAFARQFSTVAGLAHIHADRLRYELYDDASFSSSENQTVLRLGAYMVDELLKHQQSVIFDMHLPTQRLRDDLKRLAAQYQANTVVIWVQTDKETARYRASHRDRRRLDDKYSFNLSPAQFDTLSNGVNGNFKPNERTIVISGKHLFNVQAKTVWRRLQELGLLKVQTPATSRGRVDYARRNLPRNPSL
jgi:predicted kinase